MIRIRPGFTLTSSLILIFGLMVSCGPRSKSVQVNQNGSEANDSYTTAEAMGYVPRTDRVCAFATQTLYLPKNNICLQAGDSCQIQFAATKGFIEDKYGICPQIDSNDEIIEEVKIAADEDNQELRWESVETLGYLEDREALCTAEFDILYNKASHTCVEARNGCEIQFVEAMGYQEDSEELCE